MLAEIFGPDLLIVAIVLVVLLFGGPPSPSWPATSARPRTSSRRAWRRARRTAPQRPRPPPTRRPPDRGEVTGRLSRRPGSGRTHARRPGGSMASDVLAVADRLWNGEMIDLHLPPGRPHGRLRRDHRRRRLLPLLRQRLLLRHRGRPRPGRHRQRAAGPGRPRRHPHLEPRPPQHRRLLPRPHRPRLRRAGLGGGGRRAGLGRARGHRPPRAAGPLRPLHLHRRLQHDHQPPPVRLHRPELADRVPLPRPHLPRHAGPLGRRPRLRPAPREGRDRRPHRDLAGRTRGCCAAATSSSGPRPTPATPRRCSATPGSGPPRCAACSSSTPSSSSPATASRSSGPTGSARPSPTRPTCSTPWSTRRWPS